MSSSNELKTLSCILCGACVTIQTAWRAYASRKRFRKFKTFCSYFKDYDIEDFDSSDDDEEEEISSTTQANILTSEQLYLNTFVLNCLKNEFQCDVLILVQDKYYFCHSFVLWCNSRHFKEIFEASWYSRERTYHKETVRFRFKLFVSAKCWQVLNMYMYGYDISIDEDIFDELVVLANELKIDDLVAELESVSQKESQISLSQVQSSELVLHKSVNTNNNNNNDSESSVSLSGKSSLDVDTHTLKSEELKQPFLLVSNYFQFFNSVVDLFEQNKLDEEKAFGYLSNSEYIDYSQMSSMQLTECLYVLKMKMRLSNSDLIVKIINIYINKRSLTQIAR
jgi:hypothetical protein